VNQNNKIWKSKKIIHIDMDSFYASIEISDKPFLKISLLQLEANQLKEVF